MRLILAQIGESKTVRFAVKEIDAMVASLREEIAERGLVYPQPRSFRLS